MANWSAEITSITSTMSTIVRNRRARRGLRQNQDRPLRRGGQSVQTAVVHSFRHVLGENLSAIR